MLMTDQVTDENDEDDKDDENDASTIPGFLFQHYDLLSTLTALVINRHGQRRRYKWREYYENASQVCLGLISLGLKRGEIVVFLGGNEPERMWIELAVWAAGGAVAIVPPETTDSEIRRILVEVGARMALAGGEEEVQRLVELKSGLPDLTRIICWDRHGINADADSGVLDIADVMQTGTERHEENFGIFEDIIYQGEEGDLAVVIYQKNDSELKQGIRLSHRALISSARGFIDRCPVVDDDLLAANRAAGSVTDYLFSFLPHILGAIRLEFPPQPAITPVDTGDIQTTFIMHDAGEWAALGSEIIEGSAGESSLQRSLLDFFLPVGPALGAAGRSQRKTGLVGKLAGLLVFRRFRSDHGLRKIRFATSDSGPIDEMAFGAIHAIGIDLRRSYFTAETGLISMQGDGETDFAASGRPVTGVEVRVTDDGRLLVRGNGLFDGYQDDTKGAVFLTEGGWWPTGDSGNINEDGQVVLSG